MRRIGLLCLLFIFLMTGTSCGSQVQGRTVKACGAAVIALMADMVQCESYASLYSTAPAYDETIAILRSGEYDKPTAVYALSVPENELMVFDESTVSDTLADYLHSAACLSFASRINQYSGIDELAVSTIYAAQMTFVSTELTDNVIYLYTFENGAPIAVSFLPGEDHTVRAVGYFLLCDALVTDSAQSIESSLKTIGFDGVIVLKT